MKIFISMSDMQPGEPTFAKPDLFTKLAKFNKRFLENTDDTFGGRVRGTFEFKGRAYRVAKINGSPQAYYAIYCPREANTVLRDLLVSFAKKTGKRYLEGRDIYDDATQDNFVGMEVFKDRIAVIGEPDK